MLPEFLKKFVTKTETLPDKLYGFVDVYTFELPNLQAKVCQLIVGKEPMPVGYVYGYIDYRFYIRINDQVYGSCDRFHDQLDQDLIDRSIRRRLFDLVLGITGLMELS